MCSVALDMLENLSDDGGLDDEGQELHRGIASGTGQRIDLVDTVDELSPLLAQSGPGRRSVCGWLWWSLPLGAVGGANPIGVGAVEMDQVFVGLGDVNEHTGEESSAYGRLRRNQMLRGFFEGRPTAKLERVETGLTVDVVSGFGLVEEELGVRMVAKSGEVHGRAHQIAGKLVEPVGVGGIDGGAIVDGKT